MRQKVREIEMFHLFVAIVALTASIIYLAFHPLNIYDQKYSLKFHKFFVYCIVPILFGAHFADAIIEIQNMKVVAFVFQLTHAVLCLILYFRLGKFKKYSYGILLFLTVITYGVNFLATIIIANKISPYYEIDVTASVIWFALAAMVFMYYEHRKPLFQKTHVIEDSLPGSSYIDESDMTQNNVLYCRICGKRIPADSVYCPKCGTRLSR